MKKPFILLCFLFACSFQAWAQTITTIAGNGGLYGYTGDNGPATAAGIWASGLTIDRVGNLYIAGPWPIRKINTSGIITTVVGIETTGYSGDGGPATGAELGGSIESIAFDNSDNMYIADGGNNVIRKVNAAGIITTFAGNGYTGGSGVGAGGFSGDGGPATAAELSGPSGVAVDNAGNIYIVDEGNNRVRKVDISGNINTIAGTGAVGVPIDGIPATAATLYDPIRVTVDNSGNVLIITGPNHPQIRKINTAGIISTIGGTYDPGYSGDGGPATLAKFKWPDGIALDDTGNIYISDREIPRIRKIDTSGIITTIAGDGTYGHSGDGGLAIMANTGGSWSIVVDTARNIYFTDGVIWIRKICPGTPTVTIISGDSIVCITSSVILSDSTPSGIWSTNDTTIATVDNTGTVTGIALGTATISYSAFNNCGTAVATKIVTVNPLPSAGTISAIAAICPGTAYILTDAATGGLWTSSNSGIATIGSAGVVHGVAGGIATISYTVSNSCSTTVATALVTVNPSTFAGTITGTPLVCAGATTSLSDAATGGSWSSSATGSATVSGGTVTGIAAGTAIITYSVSGACGGASTTMHITVNPLPFAGTIIGTPTVCAISVAAFADATTGGTWSSSATGIATVTSYGFVTGVSGGMDTISYSVSNSCGTVAAIKPVTIIPLAVAGAITGPSAVCPGATISLSDIITGGAWSNSFTAIATISGTGVVTGVMPGVDTLFYTITTGCSAATVKKTVMVNPLPTVGTIAGTASVCAGSSTSLSDAVTGGHWGSGNTGIATIGSIGTVYGVSADTVAISYAVTNSCGTAVAEKLLTVNPLPSAGTITGTITVTGLCAGSSASLSDTVTGGAWSSANTSASVVTGLVTGLTAGTDTISYSVSNSCGAAEVTLMITVNPLPIAGMITGPSAVCADTSITLSDAATGGIWSSSDTGIASISALGIVTGASAGSLALSYAVTNSCGTATATKPVTVNPLPNAGTISGSATLCADSVIALTDAVTGGIWGSSDTGIASVDNSGIAAGVGTGTATISYTVINSCGTSVAVQPVTVAPCVLAINTPNADPGKLSIYPNPSQGTFTIILSSTNNEQIGCTIADILGKQVKEFNAQTNQPTEIKLNVPAGIYFITVSTAAEKWNEKVLILPSR